MQFQIIAALTLASFAAAAPGGLLDGLSGGSAPAPKAPKYKTVPGDVTIQQGNNVCGNDLELNCCNTEKTVGGSGLLGLLNGVGIFDGCSSLSVTALIGVNDLINDQCKQNVVCCDSDVNQSGLVNVGIPCLTVSDLL